jgi:AraC family transcriptional regulator, regulatory protein of adaptative response / methylated-DNA-[protein]-cysteine methyltransferase
LTSHLGPSPDPRLAAVHARDRRADGTFVFAVTTTGIYCRPSCPARRPKAAHVRFFDAPPQARRAGFRACRRCHPDAAADEAALLARLPAILTPDADLSAVAAALGLPLPALDRHVRRALGLPLRALRDALRHDHLRAALRAGTPVAAALYDAGFSAPSRLYATAPDHLGMTPDQFRRGAPGTAIAFATTGTHFGTLLVAATYRGLCSVTLHDTPADAEAALRRDFPRSTITPDDGALTEAVAAIVASLDGEPLPTLPLDLQATAFQRRVWEALRSIPRGETRTYAEVAEGLGQPTAVRAVARACATNPVALVTPCHRVVRSDGSLAGYRWGADRKAALLAAERS